MEMQKWAQVAEESGSRVWARPRAACHLTPSQWRACHTGAFGIPAPETNEHRHERNPAAETMPTQPSRSSKVYRRENLLSELQSGSTRHGARTGGSIQNAPGCA